MLLCSLYDLLGDRDNKQNTQSSFQVETNALKSNKAGEGNTELTVLFGIGESGRPASSEGWHLREN